MDLGTELFKKRKEGEEDKRVEEEAGEKSNIMLLFSNGDEDLDDDSDGDKSLQVSHAYTLVSGN